MFNKSQYENELTILNENLFQNEQNLNPKFIITQTQNQKENLQKKKNRQLISINNSNGRWTNEEHNKFIEGIIKYGNDWKKIQKYVSTRTSTQARSHAQKFLLKLRNNEFLKRNNIDLSLSWAKVIQLIKNSFSDDVLYKVLKDASFNKKKGKKKYLKKIKCDKKLNTLLSYNNIENENEKENNCDYDVFFSTSDYSNSLDDNKENINNFLFYQMENLPVKNSNNNINNKDYINDFIQNFNKNNLCDSDFFINDSNIYYNNSAILSINSIKNNNLNQNGDNLNISLNEV
jgi:SHAQKYF class myb-like DNA-binding protein